VGKLIELSTEELLKKFGAGNHKPGSGSATAFQALLSTQLIRTVIDLTKERTSYRQWATMLADMSSEIDSRIYPTLLNLFELDSEQFDRVIKLRRARDKAPNGSKRNALKQTLDNAVVLATETPINIAKLCVELSDFALFLCDNGFQSARGDSGVALNNAVAAIAGSLCVINLNLLSLGHNDQIEQIRTETALLKSRFQELSQQANQRLIILEDEAERHKEYHNEIRTLSSGRWIGKDLSYSEIEQLARRLQNTLWTYQDKISKGPMPENLIDILKPEIVLTKILGYQYTESPTLGQHFVGDGLFEIAGLIDKSEKSVAISQQFSKETRNFTAAHELGHAFLHQQMVLHRDKAVDGSGLGNYREPIELQADKFATYFLMPKKQIVLVFKQLFLTDKFLVNEDTVFALTGGRLTSFNVKCKNLRDLSRILASAEYYNSNSFKSMAELFHVSIETMAIRLEELELAEFSSKV
jgi:formiminotetrahydrofolate cyclodeaminase/Zn-dependent peptidase ImmA (M78 family)